MYSCQFQPLWWYCCHLMIMFSDPKVTVIAISYTFFHAWFSSLGWQALDTMFFFFLILLFCAIRNEQPLYTFKCSFWYLNCVYACVCVCVCIFDIVRLVNLLGRIVHIPFCPPEQTLVVQFKRAFINTANSLA